MFKIEDGVEICGRKYGKDSGVAYTARALNVGQSFFVANEHGLSKNSIQSSISSLSKREKLKFTTRKVDGGIRIWRVA